MLYIAPTGNDANPCTISLPCRTVIGTSPKLGPGDTLYARGGTYTGQGGYNWSQAASGTSAAWITFAAYPGETPVFDGQNQWSHALILTQVQYIHVIGISARNYGRGPTGDAAFMSYNNADHVIWQDMTATDIGLDPLDHGIYIATGSDDQTVIGGTFARITGWGVHVYHDPGPNGMFVESSTFTDVRGGVIFAANGTNGRIVNNTFTNVLCSIEVQPQFTNVVISGNSPSDATCDIS